MVHRGELRGFRVGRLIRIPWEAVKEAESCLGLEEDVKPFASQPPHQAPLESNGAITLRHAKDRRPRGEQTNKG